MDKPNTNDGCLWLAALLLLILLLVGWRGYWSQQQAALYQREGLDVTTWECFIGVHPAERAVRIKE